MTLCSSLTDDGQGAEERRDLDHALPPQHKPQPGQIAQQFAVQIVGDARHARPRAGRHVGERGRVYDGYGAVQRWG